MILESTDAVSLFDLGCKEGDKVSFGYESVNGKWTQDDDDVFIVSAKPFTGSRYTYMATMRSQTAGQEVSAHFQGLLPYTEPMIEEGNEGASPAASCGDSLKIKITKPLLLEKL